MAFIAHAHQKVLRMTVQFRIIVHIFLISYFFFVCFRRNSIPPTTTVTNLLVKQKAAYGQMCIDVGFWGGIIPGNQEELPKLIDHGVVGFKCFLCPSGVDEFPNVTEDDVETAYKRLNGSNGLIAVNIFRLPKHF